MHYGIIGMEAPTEEQFLELFKELSGTKRDSKIDETIRKGSVNYPFSLFIFLKNVIFFFAVRFIIFAFCDYKQKTTRLKKEKG
jgi:hypothetical protein